MFPINEIWITPLDDWLMPTDRGYRVNKALLAQHIANEEDGNLIFLNRTFWKFEEGLRERLEDGQVKSHIHRIISDRADYSEWLASKILNIRLSDNPVEKSFDAIDEYGKKYQIKSRIVKSLDDNTSFDFQRFGKFDYLVSVFFSQSYDLIGLLKVPISAVNDLSNKTKRRYSFRINNKTLSDERVERLIWKKN